MSRVFRCLFDWFTRYAMDPKQYRITITPLSVDAESRLMYRMARDMEPVTLDRKVLAEFRSGIIHGISFEIGQVDRP